MSTVQSSAIPIENIVASPTNPRTVFEGIEELAKSIKEHGVIQAIVVRPLEKMGGQRGRPSVVDKKFEIIAGERRFRAAKLAGLSTIPCTIRDVDQTDAIALQVVENLQREDVSPIDLARSLAVMQEAKTIDEIAVLVGKSKSWVYQIIQLNKLTELGRGLLTKLPWFSVFHAVELARAPEDIQNQIAARLSPYTTWSVDTVNHEVQHLVRLAEAARHREEAARREAEKPKLEGLDLEEPKPEPARAFTGFTMKVDEPAADPEANDEDDEVELELQSPEGPKEVKVDTDKVDWGGSWPNVSAYALGVLALWPTKNILTPAGDKSALIVERPLLICILECIWKEMQQMWQKRCCKILGWSPVNQNPEKEYSHASYDSLPSHYLKDATIDATIRALLVMVLIYDLNPDVSWRNPGQTDTAVALRKALGISIPEIDKEARLWIEQATKSIRKKRPNP